MFMELSPNCAIVKDLKSLTGLSDTDHSANYLY